MSLMTSLYSGVSGLDGSSLELSVVGDNIANANTIGFKSSRAAFEEQLAQTLIGQTGQRGQGTRLEAVQKLITQGALSNTGLATDLAIQGSGFFVVKGVANGVDGTFYTRAGQFTVDNSGHLVNLNGLRVQGYGVDAAGAITGTVGDLSVGDVTAPPVATANLTMKGNLKADAVVPPAWDVLQATTTSNFSTATTVYDSLGKAHSVDVYFRKTAAGAWEWHAVTDGGGLAGGTAGTPTEIGDGTMTFDSAGKLSALTQNSNFNPIDAVNPQPLTFDFGDATGGGGTGLLGMTQFATASAMTFQNQDGVPAGDLARVSIQGDGTIMGAFTNGQSRALGQVATADFSAADKLERLGGNIYKEVVDSGPAVIGKAGTGGRGALVAGALEQSNVDLASEFVRMIAAQRSFQANSKTITTADQLLAELISLKR